MLNPVHLVLGEDEFLAERATKAIIAQLSPAAERTTPVSYTHLTLPTT